MRGILDAFDTYYNAFGKYHAAFYAHGQCSDAWKMRVVQKFAEGGKRRTDFQPLTSSLHRN
jgi:hypothetical protein